jgi:hypothetical protein
MAVVVNRYPIKEELSPDPDGATVEFHTFWPYQPGSLSVWLNGMRLDPNLETGFTEGGGDLVIMKEPPEIGDSLQAQYDAAVS